MNLFIFFYFKLEIRREFVVIYNVLTIIHFCLNGVYIITTLINAKFMICSLLVDKSYFFHRKIFTLTSFTYAL